MDADRGPLDTYEITWRSGHVERIQAHQALWPMPNLASSVFGHAKEDNQVKLHGEIDGRWKLILSAPAEEIYSIRLVTSDEPIPKEQA